MKQSHTHHLPRVFPRQLRPRRSPRHDLALLLAGLLLTAGCDREVHIATGKFEAERRAAALSERDEVQAALAFLEDYDRYPQESAMGRVLHHLRKWSETIEPADDWIADPMFGRLPARLGLSRNARDLARLTFGPEDVDALREVGWHRSLARRLSRDPVIDDRYARWLDKSAEDLSSAERHQLRALLALFDWVVRNIQIEPVELTEAERARSAAATADNAPAHPNDDSEDIRPGVRRTAWEALLVGRGDALCRARLVILLARQIEIPVVVLAHNAPDEPAPFLLAAQVGRQWFLLEPELGLPVAGESEGSLASWSDLHATPTLLHQFDLPNRPYRHRDVDLNHMVALIDATPQALSQRMRLLELALPKDHRAVLTVTPTALRRELETLPGIQQVAIWTQPYDVDQFRRTQAAGFPALFRVLQQQLQPVMPPWPLAFARRQHILGTILDKERNEGAMGLYLAARLSDQQIDAVNSPKALQGLIQRLTGTATGVPQDPSVVQHLLAATRQVLLATRQDASFWLGLISFELGNYRVAVDYFDKRTLGADDTSPWRLGALYNLGRSYEAWGKANNDPELLRRAVEYYREESTSPQGPGNQLRAQWLSDQINAMESPGPSDA